MNVLKVEPINIKEYTVKQSTYDVVGKLPTRSISLGPFGNVKTALLQNMIWDIYIDVAFRASTYSHLPSMSIVCGCCEEVYRARDEGPRYRRGSDLLRPL